MLTGEARAAALGNRGRLVDLPRRRVLTRTWDQLVAEGKKLAVSLGVAGAVADIVERYELGARSKKDEYEWAFAFKQSISPLGGLHEALTNQKVLGVIRSPMPKINPLVPTQFVEALPRMGPPILSGPTYQNSFRQLMNQPRYHAAANRIHRAPAKPEPAPETLPSDTPLEPVLGFRSAAALLEVMSVNEPYTGPEPWTAPARLVTARFKCRLTPAAFKALKKKSPRKPAKKVAAKKKPAKKRTR